MVGAWWGGTHPMILIPAQVTGQRWPLYANEAWVPAFAGMTGGVGGGRACERVIGGAWGGACNHAPYVRLHVEEWRGEPRPTFYLPGFKGEARRAAPDRPLWAGAFATVASRISAGVVEP